MTNLPNPLSHAYLITGGNEDSRTDLANRLASAYLCPESHPPCGHCQPCRKVAAGIHPDVTVATPATGKREITVDQVRALRSDVYIRPNEGARKVYIIRPADALNPAAQNALLKVLEDGPTYAAFLLLADQPGTLLGTVRFRCELLTLPPEDKNTDPTLVDKAEQLAQLLLEGDELAVAERLVDLELEKPKSDQLAILLAQAEIQTAKYLAQYPRRGAQVLGALKLCRENGAYHPNPGHTLGWLAAELFPQR